MRRILGLVLLVLSGLAFVSCGSSGGGAQSTCEQIGTTICQKACDCREGPTCGLFQDGLDSSFPTMNDCVGFLVTLGCSQGNQSYKDAAACLPLVQAATCTGTGTEASVVYPSDPACQPP
jgi:hypothetical protein